MGESTFEHAGMLPSQLKVQRTSHLTATICFGPHPSYLLKSTADSAKGGSRARQLKPEVADFRQVTCGATLCVTFSYLLLVLR